MGATAIPASVHITFAAVVSVCSPKLLLAICMPSVPAVTHSDVHCNGLDLQRPLSFSLSELALAKDPHAPRTRGSPPRCPLCDWA